MKINTFSHFVMAATAAAAPSDKVDVDATLAKLSRPNVSNETRRDVIFGLKGPEFTSFLQKLAKLPPAQQKEIIANIGAERMKTKLLMEGLRAELTGATDYFATVGGVMKAAGWTPGLPPGAKHFFNFYGSALATAAKECPNIILRALDSTSTTMVDPHLELRLPPGTLEKIRNMHRELLR